jgi:hypothetical protein
MKYKQIIDGNEEGVIGKLVEKGKEVFVTPMCSNVNDVQKYFRQYIKENSNGVTQTKPELQTYMLPNRTSSNSVLIVKELEAYSTPKPTTIPKTTSCCGRRF